MFKKIMRHTFLQKGYHLSVSPKNEEIKEFIKELRPYATEYSLLRFGCPGDGGYLVPKDLEEIEYCFSPGVSCQSSFESDLAKFGIKSFMADYSVETPSIQSDSFFFEKKYLGEVNNDKYMTLQTWMDKSLPTGYSKDLLLQMDIESSEYNVLFETSEETLKKFRILIIEFHELHRMFDTFGLSFLKLCFRKILKDFYIVHIHPNNWSRYAKKGDIVIPEVMEFTFLRKDRVQNLNKAQAFPHALDCQNRQDKPDIILPSCWYN
ncbi:FkbM family methyltransferase [Fluviispira vulneris]|uniref:FkbM family methyltransferase n=1 Tax=Fluviispira vulneris TaxID=2763012 RepID=UPI001644F99A|nr:FkbM family methyltransferase [Fluviispira vulneris]